MKNIEKIQNNPLFLEFLLKEVNRTIVHATSEELADFAFGGMEEAVDTFQNKENE